MNNKIERKKAFIINVIYVGIFLAFFAFYIQYAFVPTLPITLAGALAIILQNPINKIVEKTKLPKGIASTLSVLFVLATFILVMFFVGRYIINEIVDFVDIIQMRLQDFAWIELQVYTFIDSLPAVIRDSIAPTINSFLVELEAAMVHDSSTGLVNTGLGFADFDFTPIISTGVSSMTSLLSASFEFIIALIIFIVAACFMATEYDMISASIHKYVPGGENNILSAIKDVLFISVWKLFKAYFAICCITAAEVFVLLKICEAIGIFSSEYILAISILSALFDILPVVGIGTVFSVWGIVSLVKADYIFCVALLVMYIIITVIRQIIEPKFIAGEMSLPASLTVSGMYIGLQAFGVMGMFGVTISLYCLKILNERGIIDLFGRDKSELSSESANGASLEMPEVSFTEKSAAEGVTD